MPAPVHRAWPADAQPDAQIIAAVTTQRGAREASLVDKLGAARRVWRLSGRVDPLRVSAALQAASGVSHQPGSN